MSRYGKRTCAKDARYSLSLPNALSGLYPKGNQEKRFLDAMLPAARR
jgi:hypothetical protein